MADEISLQNATRSSRADPSSAPGQPREQLEVEEGGRESEESITYPTGLKLWLTVGSVATCLVLNGLDLLIVAVTVPSLTDQFRTVADIGWYSSVYGIILSAFTFFFGKLYTVFSVKHVYMVSLAIFECGSLLCTISFSSKQFILGRAVAGLGASGLTGGSMTIITQSFPLHKRPLYTGIAMAGKTIAMVCSPIIGGALIDACSWRACFGINLPLGVLVFILIAYSVHDPVENPDTRLPFKEKLKRIDPIGTVLLVPSVTCLILAMQWGGISTGSKKGPHCLPGFSRSGAFSQAPGSLLAGVKGYSATKSGLLGIPMIVGLSITNLAASAGTTFIGYYTPFMFATTFLAPVAAGLLTTLKIDDSQVKILALLGFLCAAIGIGISGLIVAAQTVLTPKEAPIGLSIMLFGSGLGSSLFLSASSALFQNRLVVEIQKFSPATNATALEHVGLSDIREVVGSHRLRSVLLGYDEAVKQTFYMPVALTVATLIGSALTEWRSVKKKQS